MEARHGLTDYAYDTWAARRYSEFNAASIEDLSALIEPLGEAYGAFLMRDIFQRPLPDRLAGAVQHLLYRADDLTRCYAAARLATCGVLALSAGPKRLVAYYRAVQAWEKVVLGVQMTIEVARRAQGAPQGAYVRGDASALERACQLGNAAKHPEKTIAPSSASRPHLPLWLSNVGVNTDLVDRTSVQLTFVEASELVRGIANAAIRAAGQDPT